jgi:hypothetical protein
MMWQATPDPWGGVFVFFIFHLHFCENHYAQYPVLARKVYVWGQMKPGTLCNNPRQVVA